MALLVGYGGGYTMGFTPGIPDEGWAYRMHTRRLVVFALDGNTELPAQPPPYFPVPLFAEDFKIDKELASLGARLYGTYCGICHGGGAVANAMAPDLRASGSSLDAASFASVVRDGLLLHRAMPPFAEFSDRELDAVRHYIRYAAHRDAGLQ